MRVIVAVVLAALASVSCGTGAPDAKDRLVELDTPRASPSGEYTAYLAVGETKSARRLSIKDGKGVEVWESQKMLREGISGHLDVVWSNTVDELWIVSTDIGTYRVARDPGAGTWKMDNPDIKDEPQEVKDLERGTGKSTR